MRTPLFWNFLRLKSNKLHLKINNVAAKNVKLRTTSKTRAARPAGCHGDRVTLSALWLAC